MVKKNELALKKEETTAIAEVHDYSQFAGQGFENHTKEDYAVPFLGVLQALSPIINEKSEAKAGMLLNTVTKDLFDGKKGVVFIPAITQHVMVEWKPLDQGSGFVKVHGLDAEIVVKAKAEQEFGKYKTVKGNPASNDLIDTHYVYGIMLNEETGASEQMIVALTSTKIKVYKRWMTKARTVQVPGPGGKPMTAPLFAHKYRLTTVQEKNQKGTFFNLNVEFDGGSAPVARLATNDPHFQEAFAFFKLIQEGSVKVAHESVVETAGTEPAEEAPIPFE